MSAQPTSAFDGRPFIAGQIVGLRSWDVLDDGHLEGVAVAYQWTPGTNHAACRPPSYMHHLANQEAHEVATVGCICGFYAYTTRDTDQYGHPGRVTGIVAGTGIVTIGDLGFRAQRAEILALVRPVPTPPVVRMPTRPTPSRWGRLCHRLHHWKPLLKVAFALWVIGLVAGDLTIGWGRVWALAYAPALAAVGLALAELRGRAVHDAFDTYRFRAKLADALNRKHSVSPMAAAAVQRRYADIPWFDTVDEAVAAFPLSTVAQTPEATS
jgi:hypothetical protein